MRSPLVRRCVRAVLEATAAMQVLLLLTIVVSSVAASCPSPKPDTSQLSPEALRVYNNFKYVRLINDVTAVVIGAGRNGQIPPDAERYYLNTASQILDVFQADPRTGHDKAIVLLKNAREALPPPLQQHVAVFLLELSDILREAAQ